MGLAGQTSYPYTQDSLKLASKLPSSPINLPPSCCHITTPLNVCQWEVALQNHPDKQLTSFIIEGITNGFHIGYDRANNRLRSALKNMQSALNNPDPVDQYIANEVAAHRVIAVDTSASHNLPVHVSRFPGKWRLILDLSHPCGSSVNDGVDPALCSLHYASVDAAVAKILSLGQSSLLAKVDIEHAYRNIPIHPQDRHLQFFVSKGRH